MDLGTGKDIEEYGNIPYHLIDIRPAGYKYNLHEYLQDYQKAEKLIRDNGHKIILCGGTGMYVEAVLNGIQLPEVPENTELRKKLLNLSIEELTQILQQYKTLHNKTDIDTTARAIRAIEIEEHYSRHPEDKALSDKKRCTPTRSVIIGLDINREERRQRITNRLKERIKTGMIQEVENLLQSGISPEDLMYYGLEYKFLTQYLIGELKYNEMFTALETAIHQFSKRQMTWWRGMERRGHKIHWLQYNLSKDEFLLRCKEIIAEEYKVK